MSNWKLIALVTIAAIGLSFEFSKQTKPVVSESADLNKIIADAEHAPFVQTDTEDTVPPAAGPSDRRAGRRNSPTSLEAGNSQNYYSNPNGETGSMDLGQPPTGDNDPEKVAESTEEDDLVADDNPCDEEDVECLEAIATKQAEERQKAAEEAQAKRDQENQDDSTDEQADTQTVAEQAPVTGPGGQIGPRDATNADQPEDELVAFWVTQLSRMPDYKIANEFAGLRQSKQISSGVYYAVVDELLLDPREPIQIVAVYLLASFQSASSFEKLVGVADAAVFGSRLNKQTETYIDAYKKVNNLRHLKSVLTSSANVEVLQKAIRLVESAAQRRLNKGVQTAGEDDEVSTLDSNSASVFRGFVSVLEEIVQSVGDAETVNLANSALAQLQQILPAEPESETVASNEAPAEKLRWQR